MMILKITDMGKITVMGKKSDTKDGFKELQSNLNICLNYTILERQNAFKAFERTK